MGRMGYRGGPGGGMGQMPGDEVSRIKLALQSNRPDEAERLSRKRLERKPDDRATRLLLAQALLQLQRVDEALDEARRVAKEQPASADAHLLISAALTQKQTQRSLQEAEDEARRAVQLQPKQARTRVQLAEVLAARQNLKGALDEADEAFKLEPRQPAAHLIRGMVLLADKDAAGAVTECEAALRYDSSLFAAHFTLANALVEVRRYDDAQAALTRAQTLNPLLPAATAHSLRGRILLKQRKWGSAYREFVQAQRSSGRLARLAPVLALFGMTQAFGRYGPLVVIPVLIVLILFGLYFIPFAGPWIVMVLALGLIGFSAFTTLRQYQGAILPEGGGRYPTLAATVVVGVVVFALALYISVGVVHASLVKSPLALGIAGLLAIVAGALANYGWQWLSNRPRRPGRAARA
jgi:tetratricopeptide (TPR) repeat protein